MQRAALLLSTPYTFGRLSIINRLHARYVGILQSESASGIDSVDRPIESSEPKSNVSNARQDTFVIYGSEPSFEVVSSGAGSALCVKLPPRTEIMTFPGSIVNVSSHITSKLILDGNVGKAADQNLANGASFYQKIYTEEHPGDILLAPQRLGEIAIIHLRGFSKYILRRDAFLAKTENVTLVAGMDGTKGNQMDLANRSVQTVTGRGAIAISHYGGLYRISLAAGEDYLVNPRNLMFWESRTTPTRLYLSNPSVPSAQSPWRRYTFIRNIAENPFLQPKLLNMKTMVTTFRDIILGAPDFVKLKGPGEFYVASRVESRFEKSRLSNAFTSVNDSTAQLFDQVSTFPDRAPHQDITSRHLAEASSLTNLGKKKHHHYAEKSIDGKPSFYAEIGPNGKAIFVSTKE